MKTLCGQVSIINLSTWCLNQVCNKKLLKPKTVYNVNIKNCPNDIMHILYVKLTKKQNLVKKTAYIQCAFLIYCHEESQNHLFKSKECIRTKTTNHTGPKIEKGLVAKDFGNFMYIFSCNKAILKSLSVIE